MNKYNKCALFGCEGTTSSRRLFPNPNKYPQQFAIWLNVCRNPKLNTLPEENVYKSHRVCRRHFVADHLSVNNRLFHNAVPKLHLTGPQIQSSFGDALLDIKESQPGSSNITITTATSDVGTHNLNCEEHHSQKRKRVTNDIEAHNLNCEEHHLISQKRKRRKLARCMADMQVVASEQKKLLREVELLKQSLKRSKNLNLQLRLKYANATSFSIFTNKQLALNAVEFATAWFQDICVTMTTTIKQASVDEKTDRQSCGRIKKVKVVNCAQVFSCQVASAITRMSLDNFKSIDGEYCLGSNGTETANLLLFFNHLFDTVNGSSKSTTRCLKSAESNLFLLRWRIDAKLSKILKQINQDPFENYFGQVRQHAGRNERDEEVMERNILRVLECQVGRVHMQIRDAF
ncbi:hypothetical protein Trydic_g7722 [Trypoxylus dichotomus]